MSLFRSEEHVAQWLARTRQPRGEVVPLATVWRLAREWYVDPLADNWRPRTRDENQRVLASAGLRGEFWELPA